MRVKKFIVQLPSTSKHGSARLVAVLVAAAFAITAIALLLWPSGPPSAAEVLRDGTTRVKDIERGSFGIELRVNPRGKASAAQPARFRLYGPFELRTGKPLPVARVSQTISAGSTTQTVTVITTGDDAFVEVGGKAYVVPPQLRSQLQATVKELKRPGAGGKRGAAGLKLGFDRWMLKPVIVDGGKLGGVDTWKVESPVDVVKALTDVLTSARSFGSSTGTSLPDALGATDAAKLRRSVDEAYVEVFVGKDDRLLRKVDLKLDLKASRDASESLPGLEGARVEIIITIDDPNRPVTVTAPKNPLPAEELGKLLDAKR